MAKRLKNVLHDSVVIMETKRKLFYNQNQIIFWVTYGAEIYHTKKSSENPRILIDQYGALKRYSCTKTGVTSMYARDEPSLMKPR